MMDHFTTIVDSAFDAEALSARLPAYCSEYGFSILHTHIFHQILENKGYPVQSKVFVHEICQAPLAQLLLQQYPEFSVLMPCRISIYQAGSASILATMNMAPALQALSAHAEVHEKGWQVYTAILTMMEKLAQNG